MNPPHMMRSDVERPPFCPAYFLPDDCPTMVLRGVILPPWPLCDVTLVQVFPPVGFVFNHMPLRSIMHPIPPLFSPALLDSLYILVSQPEKWLFNLLLALPVLFASAKEHKLVLGGGLFRGSISSLPNVLLPDSSSSLFVFAFSPPNEIFPAYLTCRAFTVPQTTSGQRFSSVSLFPFPLIPSFFYLPVTVSGFPILVSIPRNSS